MKHINSTLNIRTPKGKNSLTNLFIYPINTTEKKCYYYSPSFQTQLLSIPSSENLRRNQFSKFNLGKNKNINILFNIQNDIIQHNYHSHQLTSDKKLLSSKTTTEKETIDNKDKQIAHLKKELSKTKYQISLLLNEKNTKRILDKIELSNGACLSDRQTRLSLMNRHNSKEVFSSFSPAENLSNKNVVHCFNNNCIDLKSPSAKEKRTLPQCFSLRTLTNDNKTYRIFRDDNRVYNSKNNNMIINSMEDLHKRTSNLLQKYFNACTKTSGK